MDARNKKKKKVLFRDVAILYGQRPKHPSVWYLSAYEFVSAWEPSLVSYPLTIDDAENPEHHVTLTPPGRAKLVAHKHGKEAPRSRPCRPRKGHGQRAKHQGHGSGGGRRIYLRQDADGNHETAKCIHGCTVQQVHHQKGKNACCCIIKLYRLVEHESYR